MNWFKVGAAAAAVCLAVSLASGKTPSAAIDSAAGNSLQLPPQPCLVGSRKCVDSAGPAARLCFVGTKDCPTEGYALTR